LGIAAGSSLIDAEPPRGATRRDVATPFGQVALYEVGNHVYLQRHGIEGYVAPHAIDHRAALECTIAGELDLAYAAVCGVDNLANGVGPAALTLDEYEAGRRTSRERVREALDGAVSRLAGAA